MFVSTYHPSEIDHLFMSIQTFNSQSLTQKITEDFYDYIIEDEFHHAAASFYQRLSAECLPFETIEELRDG